MVDINREADKTLKNLPYTVYFQYPETFVEMPVVSYYTISERGAFSSDNIEDICRGSVQVDIWALKQNECGDIAIEVCELMQKDDWHREMSRDLPKVDGVYHKTIRFSKNFLN